MLSIVCVRLTIKVKVGILESFRVGWYTPKKLGRVTLNKGCLTGTMEYVIYSPGTTPGEHVTYPRGIGKKHAYFSRVSFPKAIAFEKSLI